MEVNNPGASRGYSGSGSVSCAPETAGCVGAALTRNLSDGPFKGVLFPVNPKCASVPGAHAYPSLSAIPGKIDLAIIALGSPSVPDVIEDCATLGIPGALIVSAGFKECGAEGAALEERILATASSSFSRPRR